MGRTLSTDVVGSQRQRRAEREHAVPVANSGRASFGNKVVEATRWRRPHERASPIESRYQVRADYTSLVTGRTLADRRPVDPDCAPFKSESLAPVTLLTSNQRNKDVLGGQIGVVT